MASSAIITLKSGPAVQTTAVTFTNVTNIRFDIPTGSTTGILQFVSNGLPKQFELTGSNTLTLTVTLGSYTLTIT